VPSVALYVVECTLLCGFESHSLRQIYSKGLRADFHAATVSGYRDIQGITHDSVLAHGGYTVKVAIYVRESGTRKYKPASPRAMYPSDVTFCVRYTLGGKRRWEQLSVSTYKEAQAASLKRLSDLITEKCEETSIGAKISRNLALPAPRPKPEPKPVAQPGELMLDAAIDKYVGERRYEVL